MTKISMDDVKELRDATAVSIMQCKKALEEAGGGMKKNFKRHDLNGDGFIEGKELDTLPKRPRR